MRLTAILAVLFALSAAPAAKAEPLRGFATVIDGDTLVVAGRLLDLQGIAAPEFGRRCELGGKAFDCGEISRAALLDLTAEYEVVCRTEAGSPAGTAHCEADGYDLSEGMVYTGWALADPSGGDSYRSLQSEARAAERGFWRGRFLEPWPLLER